MHLKQIKVHPETFLDKDSYPYTLDILRNAVELNLTRSVSFFVGDNGAGKSTLLRAIARRADITIWGDKEKPSYHGNNHQADLYRSISLGWRACSVPGAYYDSQLFDNFATYLDEWANNDPHMLEYFGGKSLVTLSHGQSLMTYFRARYSRAGLYILDEPEAGLSPRSELEFLKILSEASSDAQFIIATHSPILMSLKGAEIFSFDHSPIQTIDYYDTAHYRTYHEFMEKIKNPR